jgi:hemolysin D
MTVSPDKKVSSRPVTAQQSGKITGRDLQFLPSALEILETPAPPASTAFMLTICAFAAAAIVWSFIGHLDVNAVAPGKIETLGYAKVIEAVDPGKISVIHVEAGGQVHSGDLLLEFDPAEANADREAAQNAWIAAIAEIAARGYAAKKVTSIVSESIQAVENSALTTALADVVDQDPGLVWDSAIPINVRNRELAVLRTDLSQLSTTIASLKKQVDAKQATIERLTAGVAQDQVMITTLTQLMTLREDTFKRELGSKTDLISARVELEKAQGQLESDRGLIKEAEAALAETLSEEQKSVGQFMADNENKLADAERRADDAKQAVNKAEAKLASTKLYAPVDGIVQRLAATTIGQVFTTGQQIMIIAPARPTLQVQALVPNTDIGFLKVGQPVVIKVDAFPFTRFGTVSGHIVRIAAEAVEEQDAKRQMATALASVNEGNSTSGGALGQAPSFVFPITVALDQTTIPVDGVSIPLSSGMTVVAEIRTGQRRIIDYLISPIAKITGEAFKER